MQSLANLAKQAGTSARTVVRCVTRCCLHEEVGAPTPYQGTNRERSRVDPRGMIGPNHAKNGDFQLLQSPVFDGPSTHTRTQCHLPHTLLNPPSALRLPAPTTSARRWHSSRTLILAWQTCSAPTASLHAPRGWAKTTTELLTTAAKGRRHTPTSPTPSASTGASRESRFVPARASRHASSCSRAFLPGRRPASPRRPRHGPSIQCARLLMGLYVAHVHGRSCTA